MHRQNRTLKQLTIIALILTLSPILAAAETTVSVDAPEYVLSDTFDAEIRIENVDELDSGEFHLIFDPNVVNVTDVVAGSMDAKTVEITGVVDKRYDKIQGIGIIRVAFNIGGEEGASGSGSLSTIRFEVTGKDGDCSFLNISNPNPIIHIKGFEKGELIDWTPEEISANWVNAMVTIGDPPDTEKHAVTVYAKNIDDDKLDVHLLVDGSDEGFKRIDPGKTKEYDDYSMEEGVHTFTIRWFDIGTDEWYEKTENHTITDVTTIILQTDEHAEDKDKISAHVYAKNLDDDDLNVYLYIDEKYKKYMSISSNSTGDYGEYEFEGDEDALHSFKIIWHDPGTDEDYEKITRSYITSEEAVTLYIDKHTEEDIILVSDETPTPVPTHSTPVTTSTRSASNPQPPPSNTPGSTAFHTDPTLSENSAENSGLGHGITPFYTLIGVVAALFALMQIRRI